MRHDSHHMNMPSTPIGMGHDSCRMKCLESSLETLSKGHKSANDWSESSFDFLNFLVCYSQKNRSVLVDLFNMNCQPQNPADWKKLFWDLKPESDFRQGITEYKRQNIEPVWSSNVDGVRWSYSSLRLLKYIKVNYHNRPWFNYFYKKSLLDYYK